MTSPRPVRTRLWLADITEHATGDGRLSAMVLTGLEERSAARRPARVLERSFGEAPAHRAGHEGSSAGV